MDNKKLLIAVGVLVALWLLTEPAHASSGIYKMPDGSLHAPPPPPPSSDELAQYQENRRGAGHF